MQVLYYTPGGEFVERHGPSYCSRTGSMHGAQLFLFASQIEDVSGERVARRARAVRALYTKFVQDHTKTA